MARGDYRLRRHLFLGIRDFAAAFLLVWGIASGTFGLHAPAYAVTLPANFESGAPIVTRTAAPNLYGIAAARPLGALNPLQASNRTTVMLSAVLALLATGNLAFLRHLRRAYARPKSLKTKIE